MYNYIFSDANYYLLYVYLFRTRMFVYGHNKFNYNCVFTLT